MLNKYIANLQSDNEMVTLFTTFDVVLFLYFYTIVMFIVRL